jgi:hypothetical protein
MAVRQLAEREAGGIVVELFWNDSRGDVFVEYRDGESNVAYTLYPPRERALEAFYHPNAFMLDAEHVAFVLRPAA